MLTKNGFCYLYVELIKKALCRTKNTLMSVKYSEYGKPVTPVKRGLPEICGPLQGDTLFKMGPDKINIAVKVFQRSIMI